MEQETPPTPSGLVRPQRKVLVIDDNRTNLALMKAHLKQMNLLPLLANDAQDGLNMAFEERPALIFLDVMMPGLDGYEVCKRLKADARTSAIPIIFISAKDQAPEKVAGLKLGAIDYISKPFDPAELKARITIVLQMIELQEHLVDRANTDELTNLGNRRFLMEMLEREIMQAHNHGTEISLLMIDLDHFKSINDTYGHLGGDVILRQLAGILRNHVQQLDIVARYGGEEFVVVMPATAGKQALAAAERLRQKVAESHWKVSSEKVPITISLGVTTLGAFDHVDMFDFIKRADTALYVAKRRGRDCVVRWEDIGLDEGAAPQVANDEVKNLQSKLITLACDLRMQMLAGVAALTRAMEARDPYTLHHSENVQAYARAIAEEMHLEREFIEHLIVAAQLHDLGKLSVPDAILLKSGELSPEERKVVEQHPLVSIQILEPLGLTHEELRAIKHHHERFDGTGYPSGLVGKKIPFSSRVIAVADTFDSLTANDAFRATRLRDQAIDEICQAAGTQFDPEVVEVFLRVAQKHTEDWPLHTAKELAFTS